MSFELEAAEVDCTSWEWGQEKHSFFPSCCEAYVGFDVDSDILDPGLTELNEEGSKVVCMVL